MNIRMNLFPHRAQRLVAILLAVVTMTGCSSKFSQKLDFDPAEPLRVAVLPFVQVDEQGKIIKAESRLVVDNLSLLSDAVNETPAQLVRKQVLAELKNSSLDVLSVALVDIDLPHQGFGLPDGTIDLEKLYATDPGLLCTKFLNCDAVLYGRIHRWDRSYYAVQSVNTVDIGLTLVSAKTKQPLFTARGEDTESRGLTKGPTGFSSLVLEPIKGLDAEIINNLARTTVTRLLTPLNVRERPGFLQSEPPSIFAASHSAPEGRFSSSKPLVVVMAGTSGQQANFSVGSVGRDVPMFERSPGNYYGEFVPLPGEHFSNEEVRVSLTDQFARTTTKKVSLPPVSLE